MISRSPPTGLRSCAAAKKVAAEFRKNYQRAAKGPPQRKQAYRWWQDSCADCPTRSEATLGRGSASGGPLSAALRHRELRRPMPPRGGEARVPRGGREGQVIARSADRARDFLPYRASPRDRTPPNSSMICPLVIPRKRPATLLGDWWTPDRAFVLLEGAATGEDPGLYLIAGIACGVARQRRSRAHDG